MYSIAFKDAIPNEVVASFDEYAKTFGNVKYLPKYINVMIYGPGCKSYTRA